MSFLTFPVLGSLPDFPGYIRFDRADASATVEIGAVGLAWADVNGLTKRLCDESAHCELYSDRTLRVFKADPSKVSYMSISRCVGAQTGVNISGGCTSSGSPSCYWMCAGSHGEFLAINNEPEQVPVETLIQACSRLDQCVGLTTDALGLGHGVLLQPAVDATASYSIKLPSCTGEADDLSQAMGDGAHPTEILSQAARGEARDIPTHRRHLLMQRAAASAVELAGESKAAVPPGFYALPWALPGASVRSVAFGPGTDPDYDPTAMSTEAMMTLCATKPFLCSLFVDQSDWATQFVPTSEAFTTFVSNRTCSPGAVRLSELGNIPDAALSRVLVC